MADLDVLYRQHLTEADRQLLAAAAPADRSLGDALAQPSVEAAVFGPARPDATIAGVGARLEGGGEWPSPPGRLPGVPGWLAGTSPFLSFAVAVHRTANRLETARYVEERWASRRRIPIFDVGPLRELLTDAGRRFFLVELLASYTHVSSGATWERTRRGWRRRKFSELDILRLAELLDTVDGPERAGVYRRLGDLALFLTGVFPDHRSSLTFRASAAGRLARAGGLPPQQGDTDEHSGHELLERLGSRWYAMTFRSAQLHGAPMTAGLAVVRDMGERFRTARRVLNVITDWYLFPLREGWFGAG